MQGIALARHKGVRVHINLDLIKETVMVANEERAENPSVECAELVTLGVVSEHTRGTFLGFNIELSIAGWWF
jgi:hypothetical protein